MIVKHTVFRKIKDLSLRVRVRQKHSSIVYITRRDGDRINKFNVLSDLIPLLSSASNKNWRRVCVWVLIYKKWIQNSSSSSSYIISFLTPCWTNFDNENVTIIIWLRVLRSCRPCKTLSLWIICILLLNMLNGSKIGSTCNHCGKIMLVCSSLPMELYYLMETCHLN